MYLFSISSVVDQTRDPRTAQLQRQQAQSQAPAAMLLLMFTGSAEASAHCHVDLTVLYHTYHGHQHSFPRALGVIIPSNQTHFTEFDFASAFIILNQMGMTDWQALWAHTATAQPEISFWSFQSAHYSRKQQPWSCAAFEQPCPHPEMLCKASDMFPLFGKNEFTQPEAFPQCLSFVYRFVSVSLKKAEEAQAAMQKVLSGLIISVLLWNQHIT